MGIRSTYTSKKKYTDVRVSHSRKASHFGKLGLRHKTLWSYDPRCLMLPEASFAVPTTDKQPLCDSADRCSINSEKFHKKSSALGTEKSASTHSVPTHQSVLQRATFSLPGIVLSFDSGSKIFGDGIGTGYPIPSSMGITFDESHRAFHLRLRSNLLCSAGLHCWGLG